MSVRVWCEDLMTGVLSSGIMEIRRLGRLVVLRLHKETPRDDCKAVQASIASASSSSHAFPLVPERAYSIHMPFLGDHPMRPSKLHHTTLHGALLPYQALHHYRHGSRLSSIEAVAIQPTLRLLISFRGPSPSRDFVPSLLHTLKLRRSSVRVTPSLKFRLIRLAHMFPDRHRVIRQ